MTADPNSRRLAYALAGVALLAYLLLIGTFAGERWPAVRLIGTACGGAVLVGAALAIRRRTDVIDWVSLAALGLFLVACLTSTSPRLSLEAAMTATTITFAFLLAREAMADPDARAVFVTVVALAGTAAATAFGLVWLGIWIGWGQAFDFRFAPPLDLPLPSGPFGYRHHVADFVALCAPAMVIHAREHRGAARLLAVVGLMLGGFVIVAAGSRMIWLACIVAGVATALSQGGLGRSLSVARGGAERFPRWVPYAVAAAFIVGVIVLAGPLLARITQLSPLEARTEIWGRAIALGLERPLTGWGPGSFTFLLQQSDYFDFNVYAPRHPDNAVVMAVAEAGLLGLAALALLWACAIWFLVRRQTPAPTVWVVVFFGLVSLTASPTDYGFLYAPFLGWIAWGLPRTGPPDRSSRLRFVALGALVPVVVAFGAIGLAAIAHESARTAAAEGDYAHAEDEASRAVALDPAFAIYRRDLGWIQLASGRAEAALASFDAAIARNPADIPAIRGASLAALASGNPQEAIDRALEAVTLRRSDPRNAMLAAYVGTQTGANDIANQMAQEAIEQQPLIVASPAWGSLGLSPMTALAEAADETDANSGTTVGSRIPSLRVAWLAALAGEPALRDRAIENAGPYRHEGELLLRYAGCELTSETLTELPSRIYPQFWEVRLVLGALLGADQADALAQSTLQIPSIEERASGDSFDTPLENEGSVDHGAYRRRPVELRDPIVQLPTLDSAIEAWLGDGSVAEEWNRCG